MQYCHIEYIVYVAVKVYNRTLYYNAIEALIKYLINDNAQFQWTMW